MTYHHIHIYPKATSISQGSSINKALSLNIFNHSNIVSWHKLSMFIMFINQLMLNNQMHVHVHMHDLPHLSHYITTPMHQCIFMFYACSCYYSKHI